MSGSINAAFNITVNGVTDEIETWGPAFIKVNGTWGGATVAVQFKNPAGNWISIDADTWTADAEKEAFFPFNIATTLRFSVTNATTTTLIGHILGSARAT